MSERIVIVDRGEREVVVPMKALRVGDRFRVEGEGCEPGWSIAHSDGYQLPSGVWAVQVLVDEAECFIKESP